MSSKTPASKFWPEPIPVPLPMPDDCGNVTCTIPEVRADGVYIASNIAGSPAGGYAGNHEEWAAFIEQVKAGKWDHTVTLAKVPTNA